MDASTAYRPQFFSQRFGAYADAVHAADVRTYGHLAVAVSVRLYEQDGELEPHQERFRSAVAAAGRIIDRAERNAAYDRALRELDEFTGLDADEREELERSREMA